MRFERRDELAERRDALADFGQQRVADRKIGDEARIVFAESDQHLAFLGDPLDRKPTLAAIAPWRVGQRIEPALRLDLADALEILGEHALLRGDLRSRRQVLQRAAAAGAEVRTTRLDALGRSRQQRLDARFVETAMARADAHDGAFAGQCARDEHGLAVDTGDAATVVGQIGDLDFV